MGKLAALVSLLAAAAVSAPSAQTAKKHFLWAVRDGGGPPAYLMGSLHVLTPDYYPLSATIEQAFAASKVLIEEVDLDELTSPATALSLLGKAMLTGGRTLDQVISPSLYKEVIARAEKSGLAAVAIRQMKPWMAAVALTAPALQAEGFRSDLGIDRYFYDKAKKAGLETRGLETAAYQFDRLDQMSAPLQESMLKSVIADLDTQLSHVKEIADAWSRGATAETERFLLDAMSDSPELYQRLLVERNRNWVAPVEECLKTRTPCFVVVGAAHLVGPDSLVAMLQKKGYTVEQQ